MSEGSGDFQTIERRRERAREQSLQQQQMRYDRLQNEKKQRRKENYTAQDRKVDQQIEKYAQSHPQVQLGEMQLRELEKKYVDELNAFTQQNK